jgi:hypothetical protein
MKHGLRSSSLRGAKRRSNLFFVIPGWCASTRPGISRFRARCGACHRAARRADPLASPRNDGCWIASRSLSSGARSRDPLARNDGLSRYGWSGWFSMYSPRSRWRRSARAVALLRRTSRSLRQATYSLEPTATLLARQIASSSPLESTIVGRPRSRQPASRGARSNRAMWRRAELRRICQFHRCFCFVIAGLDPAIHRNKGIF